MVELEKINDSLYAKMNAKLDEKKQEIAKNLLKEQVDPHNVTFATDYIFNRIERDGISQLDESINDASLHFKVPANQLVSVIKEAFYEESKGNELIEALIDIGKEEVSAVYTFDNKTSKVITLGEAVSMLGFWLDLSPENRKIMESDIKRSRSLFEKYLGSLSQSAQSE